MLEGLGDAALLGVQLAVHGRHLVERLRQLLGVAPPSHEALGEQRRGRRQREADERDDHTAGAGRTCRPGTRWA